MSRSCQRATFFERVEHVRTAREAAMPKSVEGDGLLPLMHGGTAACCSPAERLLRFAYFVRCRCRLFERDLFRNVCVDDQLGR